MYLASRYVPCVFSSMWQTILAILALVLLDLWMFLRRQSFFHIVLWEVTQRDK
jgi:hypothetical protein